jgi:hypothetical protein
VVCDFTICVTNIGVVFFSFFIHLMFRYMLSLKIPVISIIDKIRGHFSDRDNRDSLDDIKYYHLIDRKTIHNLKTKLSDPTVIQDLIYLT